jgi:hypothetical protein
MSEYAHPQLSTSPRICESMKRDRQRAVLRHALADATESSYSAMDRRPMRGPINLVLALLNRWLARLS